MSSTDAAWESFRAAPVDPITRHYWQISIDIVRNNVTRYTTVCDRVLDVGCGTGVRTVGFARCGRRCVGIDPSETAIEASRRAAAAASVEVRFRVAAAEDLPFDSHTFDAVVMASVLQHVDDQRLALAEARRVLKPGGVLVVAVPQTLRPSTRRNQGLYTMHFTLKSLDRLLTETGFTIKRIEGSGLLLPATRPVLLALDRVCDGTRLFDELETVAARFPQVASSLHVVGRVRP